VKLEDFMKRTSVFVFALAVSTLFAALPVWCTTRNVSSAAGCSDSTGNPYCTINAAILAASAGDTIQIAAGTYTGTIASFSKSLTFVGAGSSTSGTVITKAVTYTGVGPLSLSNLRISGGGTNFKVSGTGSFAGLTLSGDAFVGNGSGAHGVYLKQSGTVSNVTVTNCSFTGHGQSGMLIEPGTGTATAVNQVTVTGSTFDGNGEYGLRIDPPTTNLQVSTSTITNNAIDGLLLLNTNGATFQNLTITGNRNGILLIPLTSAQSISNLTFTNVNASNNTRFISGHYGSGLTLTGDTGAISHITITGSTFSGNGIHGIDSTGAVSQVTIDCSVIGPNVQQGIREASSPSALLTAKHVYWGCATGPNTAGCSTVTGNLAFLPFRASSSATCTPSADLGVSKIATPSPVPTGASLTYTLTVVNNGPDPATGVVFTDTLPPSVTFVSASGCTANGGVVTCGIGNLASGQQAVRTVTVIAPVAAGTVTNTVTIAGNETPDPNATNNSAIVTTTVQNAVTLSSVLVTPTSATLAPGHTVQLTATATYSDNSTQNVTTSAAWTSSVNGVATVTASGLVTAAAQGTSIVTATLGAVSATATISVTTTESLPPDPATIATAIDPTAITTVFTSTKFLYDGPTPVQTGVAAGAIDPLQMCVLRGSIADRSGQPVSGVLVSIFGHGEYGHTLSRADGKFDIAVNGGTDVTIQYRKSGFAPVDRQASPHWNDFVVVDPVTLIAYDSAATVVDLAATGTQVARGSVSVDADGSRTATLLFPASTSATMQLPDGSNQSISHLTIRATEYTVGQSGPNAMPATLPPTSAYTYCVELSADEAVTAGATGLTFSQAVPLYVENFLNFPVGQQVPVGYYDRSVGRWIGETNGRVLQIVQIVEGRAYIDVTGDGLADDSDALIGTTPDERQQLAVLYHPGQTLWRVPLSHFSPWDCNWPYGLPDGADGPSGGSPSSSNDRTDTPNCRMGSIVECENQILGEVLPVAGTSFSLHYRSDRVPGRTANNTIKIPISGSTVPSNTRRIEMQINVAGRRIEQSFSPTPNQSYTFVWDGLDVYGRLMQSEQPIRIRIGNVFGAVYRTPQENAQAFATYGDPALMPTPTRGEVTIWNDWKGKIGTWNAGTNQLGGWTLSIVHSYDPFQRLLYQGDGIRRSAAGGEREVARKATPEFTPASGPAIDRFGNIYIGDGDASFINRVAPDGTISRIAGDGDPDVSGDGGPATQAKVFFPSAFRVAPDGSLYFSDFIGTYIRRISAQGIISTIAGTGPSFTNVWADGTPATSASFRNANFIALGPGGEVYFATGISSYSTDLFCVTPNGRLRHIGGAFSDDPFAPSVDVLHADGHSAVGVRFNNIQGIAVDHDGAVFFVSDAVVWKLGGDGIVHLFAGSLTASEATLATEANGFNGPARDVAMPGPEGLAFGTDGSLYINDIAFFAGRALIHRVTHGILTTIAGGGASTSGDGGPALQSELFGGEIALDPDDNVLSFQYDPLTLKAHISKIGSALPGVSAGQATVASSDGSQLFVFASSGRHIRTLDAHSGTIIYEFAYSTAGLLTSVTDVDGNVTRIERDASGTPTAILAPRGQRTLLTESGGYLAQITDPAGQFYSLGYTPDGLLTSVRDPRGNSSIMTYDPKGLLTRDTSASGSFTNLSRTDFSADDHTVIETTALNRITTHQTQKLTSGALRTTTTAPDGTHRVTVRGTDGTITSTSPDGTVSSVMLGADPRWGMDAPVIRSITTTPGHRSLDIAEERAVVVSDPNNPLSLVSETRKLEINNRTFSSVFDRSSGRLTATTPAGRQTTASIDPAGRIVREQYGNGALVQYGYDGRGLLTSRSVGSRLMAFGYDTFGQLTSFTDPLSRLTAFGYDAAGRVVRQTMPDQREILYSYDANGNLTGVTPPSRPRHTFSFGLVNETRTYTPPLTGSTQYIYNADRQLMAIVQADGARIDVGYDATGRASTVTHADGQLIFAYDAVNGALQSVTGPTGALSYSHDGPLSTGEAWSGVVTGQVGFTYNNDFRITAETVNAGNSISYGYDADGLITSAGALTLARDAQKGLVSSSQIGAVGDSYIYNDLGEVTSYTASVNGSPIFALSYTRDAAGRIAQVSDTTQGTNTAIGYGYDNGARLATTTRDGVRQSSYSYDANNNRLSQGAVVGTTTATYDDEDHLLTYGSATYGYSPRGDLQSRTDTVGTTTYHYDAFGNLLHVTLPNGAMIDYVVDAQNRRTAKKLNGTLIQGFLYRNQLNVVAELDSTGVVRSRFIYAASAVVPTYMMKGGSTYRIVSDGLGSPRLVVDVASGSVVQRMDYDEFGNVVADTNPGFQPFGFAGGLYDADTKLVRFGARDYDPQTGRWTAKDPIGFGGGSANLYSYAATDPVNFFDSAGLEHVQEPGFTKPLTAAGPPITVLFPDYLSINVNVALPWTHGWGGWSALLSADRYGHWYWSLSGGGIGKPTVSPVSGSCTANWVDQLSQSTPEHLRDLLTGNGINVTGGYWLGLSQSYTPGIGGATGIGIVTPQIGASYNYSYQGPGSTGATW
jgi:RHS repeat-associated protein/uncharacterized repeat protein (TIGR01451 family)